MRKRSKFWTGPAIRNRKERRQRWAEGMERLLRESPCQEWPALLARADDGTPYTVALDSDVRPGDPGLHLVGELPQDGAPLVVAALFAEQAAGTDRVLRESGKPAAARWEPRPFFDCMALTGAVIMYDTDGGAFVFNSRPAAKEDHRP